MCRHISYIVQSCNPHRGPDIFSCTLHRLLHRCVPPGLEIGRRGGLEGFGAVSQPRARTRVSCVRIWVAGRLESFVAGRLEIWVAGGLEIWRRAGWRVSWWRSGNPAVSDLEGLGRRASGWKSESVSGGRASGRQPRAHAGMQKSCIFPAFLTEKFLIGKLKKSGENPLAHSAASPDQFYGMEPCEMAREKWGAASPRSCVPLSQMSQ